VPPSVVVIDSTDSRASSLGRALENAGADVVQVVGIEGKAVVDEGRDLPDTVNLALVHAGEIQWMMASKFNITAARTIYYGGNGGLDIRIRADKDRIWRPVLIDAGLLTTEEAGELLAYAADLHAPKPGLLCPPDSFPLLRTLGALCIGYLAVHTAKRYDDNVPPTGEVATTLGWTALSASDRQYLSSGPLQLPERQLEVERPDWWIIPLTSAAGHHDQILPALDLETRDAARRGLKDAGPVRQLVKTVLQRSATLLFDDVAQAYLALCKLEQW
jgi:hypothetical protein